MGVLACDRNGCENIMCDYYSPEHGYLCWECKSELIEKGFTDICNFMHSTASRKNYTKSWDDYVNVQFKDRRSNEDD